MEAEEIWTRSKRVREAQLVIVTSARTPCIGHNTEQGQRIYSESG